MPNAGAVIYRILVHILLPVSDQYWQLSTAWRYTPVSNLYWHNTGGQYCHDGKRYSPSIGPF
ncbi:hypothetical protein X777_07550 [Ooceraea biroi]|uniref:Uncharacterized protein n=1 Tax=Ooceraea biroi TaxID=2015173 RepID=A0A026X5K9_OOCBI|nr:hypothetical protein X777_05299 [Ooceraea biroi]EZA62734.1 hypothetical protein X777_07550 [Ooceraea biroi]